MQKILNKKKFHPRCVFDGSRLLLLRGGISGWCIHCGAWRQADNGGKPTQMVAEAEREKWRHFTELILNLNRNDEAETRHSGDAGTTGRTV